MKHIFFVEDDLSLISGLSFAIKKQGYEVDIVRTVAEAQNVWQEGKYDLVILDVSLPDGNGYDLCCEIRKTSKIPIIFLTAADEETDIIMGLDIGGDDYITKPFKLAVLLSRINALLRRSENFNQKETELSSNGIRVDLLRSEVYKNGMLIDLTASEYKLLCLFMEHPDIILSPEQILNRLWDCDEKYIDGNTLTVYIRRLRTKIEDITELDRLGRNKQEILKQLQILKDKGVRVMVLELPTTLIDLSQMDNALARLMIETINNVLIEIYASLAQAEMEKKEKRQREGMEAKKLRGEWDEVGRPRAIEPEKFNHEFLRVIEKEVTPTQLQRELGLTASTFYRYRKDFFEKFPQFVQFQK